MRKPLQSRRHYNRPYGTYRPSIYHLTHYLTHHLTPQKSIFSSIARPLSSAYRAAEALLYSRPKPLHSS